MVIIRHKMPLHEQLVLGFDYSRAGIVAARHLKGKTDLLIKPVVSKPVVAEQETGEECMDRIWESAKKQMTARKLGEVGLYTSTDSPTETDDQLAT